jgi:hypothetical protein
MGRILPAKRVATRGVIISRMLISRMIASPSRTFNRRHKPVVSLRPATRRQQKPRNQQKRQYFARQSHRLSLKS